MKFTAFCSTIIRKEVVFLFIYYFDWSLMCARQTGIKHKLIVKKL
jgi:hypothetical protein